MSKISAGLLMYRQRNGRLEIFLVHPGGPFFKYRDVWGIPKGRQNDNEDLLETAKREFCEETGIILKPDTKYLDLGNIKNLYAWAFEDGDFDPKKLVSNVTAFGWPEIDKGDYFPITEAQKIILKSQQELLQRLTDILSPLA